MKMKKNNLYFFGNPFSIKASYLVILSFLIIIIFVASCDVNDGDYDKLPPCPPFQIISTPPYDSPAWHPSGEFIGFNHTPLLKITYPYGEHCQGVYEWDPHQFGFWLINPDGSNMRRIFPYKLLNPVWSPDGEWIAFVLPMGDERHICKMRFNGETFDTTTLVQLTTEGRNFLPSWSPDGEKIAYNRSICNGPQTCGIWLMKKAGENNHFLASYGNYPEWNSSNSLFFLTRSIDQTGNAIGDTLWSYIFDINTKQYVASLKGSNRHIKYLRNKNLIIFWSDGYLWLMDSTGSNKRQITTESVDVDFGHPFSLSRDGKKIVYTKYEPNNWTYENGTLWIIDLISGEKRQLTFNPKPNN